MDESQMVQITRDILKWKDEIIMSLLQKVEHDRKTIQKLKKELAAAEQDLQNQEAQIDILEQRLERQLK